MKIRILLLLAFILPCFIHGQNYVVEMMNNKVTQMIFPTTIKTVKGGFIPEDFVLDKQDNVLYIQPLDIFPESNINIVTIDNVYYTFTIRYNDKTTQFNHIITTKQAIFNPSSIKENAQEQAPIIEKENTNIENIILTDNGNHFPRQAIRYKTTYMYLKGVYSNENKLYIKLLFENMSNIPYDFEFIGFYITEKKQRKNTTQEQVQMFPENIYNKINTIRGNNSIEMVFVFDKFTIGKDKILLIDMIEKGGERNLSLKINDTILLNARKI